MQGLTPEAEDALTKYRWPGNVRELRNVVHQAVVLGGTGLLRLEHLPQHLLGAGRPVVPAEDTSAHTP